MWAIYGCTAPYRRSEKAKKLKGIAESLDGFRHAYMTRDERVLELVQALHRGATAARVTVSLADRRRSRRSAES